MVENYTKDIKESVYHGAVVSALAVGYTMLGKTLTKMTPPSPTKKRQEQLDYINNQIMKEHKAEKRFTDLNSAMQQYFIVTGRQLEPLPPKPVLSDYYMPSEDHHLYVHLHWK